MHRRCSAAVREGREGAATGIARGELIDHRRVGDREAGLGVGDLAVERGGAVSQRTRCREAVARGSTHGGQTAGDTVTRRLRGVADTHLVARGGLAGQVQCAIGVLTGQGHVGGGLAGAVSTGVGGGLAGARGCRNTASKSRTRRAGGACDGAVRSCVLHRGEAAGGVGRFRNAGRGCCERRAAAAQRARGHATDAVVDIAGDGRGGGARTRGGAGAGVARRSAGKSCGRKQSQSCGDDRLLNHLKLLRRESDKTWEKPLDNCRTCLNWKIKQEQLWVI